LEAFDVAGCGDADRENAKAQEECDLGRLRQLWLSYEIEDQDARR
jgi:hypothetical protein